MNKQEVIKLIGKGEWNNFQKWMTGQTIGVNKDGSDDYYKQDVDKFINKSTVLD